MNYDMLACNWLYDDGYIYDDNVMSNG